MSLSIRNNQFSSFFKSFHFESGKTTHNSPAAQQIRSQIDEFDAHTKNPEIAKLVGGDSFRSAPYSPISAKHTNASASTLMSEDPNDTRVNCLDKAVDYSRSLTPEQKKNAELVFLSDNRSGEEGKTGHVVIKNGDQIVDPSSGKKYSDIDSYLKENPQYKETGRLKTTDVEQIMKTPPGSAERQAAIDAAEIPESLKNMLVADWKDNIVDAGKSLIEHAIDASPVGRATKMAAKKIKAEVDAGFAAAAADTPQIEQNVQEAEEKLKKAYDKFKKTGEPQDITAILNELGEKNAQIASKYKDKNPIFKMAWWEEMVNTGKPLDLKNRSTTLTDNGENIWQAASSGKTSAFTFNGESMRTDAPGNILYGYTGSAILGGDILKYGAGAAQAISDIHNADGAGDKVDAAMKYIKNLLNGNCGDNPGDAVTIQKGIDAYNQAHA